MPLAPSESPISEDMQLRGSVSCVESCRGAWHNPPPAPSTREGLQSVTGGYAREDLPRSSTTYLAAEE